MDYKTRQEQLDDKKWYESILAKRDLCGSYDFCEKCRKTDVYPCARAEYRLASGYVRIAVITKRKK